RYIVLRREINHYIKDEIECLKCDFVAIRSELSSQSPHSHEMSAFQIQSQSVSQSSLKNAVLRPGIELRVTFNRSLADGEHCWDRDAIFRCLITIAELEVELMRHNQNPAKGGPSGSSTCTTSGRSIPDAFATSSASTAVAPEPTN